MRGSVPTVVSRRQEDRVPGVGYRQGDVPGRGGRGGWDATPSADFGGPTRAPAVVPGWKVPELWPFRGSPRLFPGAGVGSPDCQRRGREQSEGAPPRLWRRRMASALIGVEGRISLSVAV